MSLTLLATLALAPCPQSAPVDETARGALALRQLIGSRVVADAETELGVDVIGAIDDVLLDSETGIVVRVLVRQAIRVDDDATEPIVRTVPFNDLAIAVSGRRAISTFALTPEDFLALPEFDRERDLRRDDDSAEPRLVVASELRGLALSAAAGPRVGAVTDLWIDLETDRVDFLEHSREAGEREQRAAAPWQAVTWESDDAGPVSGSLGLGVDAIRAVPAISVAERRTLRHARYRAAVRSSYGTKEPDTSSHRASSAAGGGALRIPSAHAVLDASRARSPAAMARTRLSGQHVAMSQATYPRLAVIGHDGRDGGQIALEAALGLRTAFGTELVVVHGVGLPAARDIAGRPGEADRMRTEVCERLERELQATIAELEGAGDVELAVFPGNPAQAIAEVAQKRRADVVVLGPHKRDGLLDFGRTARAALSAAPCDVWVQPARSSSPTRILVPFDGSENALHALDVARGLARGFGAKVTAFQAYAAPEFAAPSPDGSEILMPMYVIEEQRAAMKKRFEEEVEAIDGELEARFVDGEPSSAIVDEQQPSDLVVMGTHGRTGLAAALLGGVAASVIKRSNGPVLAVRAKQGK